AHRQLGDAPPELGADLQPPPASLGGGGLDHDDQQQEWQRKPAMKGHSGRIGVQGGQSQTRADGCNIPRGRASPSIYTALPPAPAYLEKGVGGRSVPARSSATANRTRGACAPRRGLSWHRCSSPSLPYSSS